MRKVSQILTFNLFLNGASVIVDASGLAEDLGVNPQTGAAKTLEAAAQAGQNVSVNANVVESLMSLVISGVGVVLAIAQGTYAAPQMFLNLGFPVWATAFLFAPLYFFGAMGVVGVVTGRNL